MHPELALENISMEDDVYDTIKRTPETNKTQDGNNINTQLYKEFIL